MTVVVGFCLGVGLVPAELQEYIGLSELKEVTNIRLCSRYWSFAEEMVIGYFGYSISKGSTRLMTLSSPSYPSPLP